MAEYRISVYGRKQSEWDQLASWFVNNEIYSENAVWLIQVFAILFVNDVTSAIIVIILACLFKVFTFTCFLKYA